MAGKLKAMDAETALKVLRENSARLASCVSMLEDKRGELEKSIKCQINLSRSLKPILTGFTPTEENVQRDPEAGEEV
ncbi:hypothetical protein GDO78_003409 [Eleutherodactylus coqui]|uniref:Uncharacterized protein n=1 Tax=Eleutherodactylus coqui TaxID=57060 RepID=A0A8J6ESQ8_ELECQ|nr:hypothetical protein GDO78_003409 [Eleutherodactylus coqui]